MGGYASPLGQPRYRRSPLVSDYAPYDPDADPSQMFRNERARATTYGDISEQEYQDAGPHQQNLEEGYRQRGDELYGDLLDRPGYSPDETNRIVREQELQDLLPGRGEFDRQQFTQGERGQIRGDPYQPMQALNPDQMLEIGNQGLRWQDEAIRRSTDVIRPTVYDEGLLQDEGYGGRQRGTVGGLERNVRGAIDPRTLRLDPNFAASYPVSDAEIRQTEQLAGRSAAQPFTRVMGEAGRRAAASGSVPGAIGALGDRLARGAAVEQGYAATDARLRGMDLQRGQRRDLEQMRLDAERDLSGRRTDAEFGLAGTRLGTESDIEQGRLAARQGRAGLIAGTEGRLLSENTNALRSGNDSIQRAAEFNQGMAFEGLRGGEQSAADRNAFLATNRQQQDRYGSEQGFDRGVAVNDRLSGRYGAVSDARRADEQEGRGYVTGQQQQAGSRQNDLAQQRLQARDISQRGSLGAAGAAGDYKNARGSFLTREILPTLDTLSRFKPKPLAEGGVVDRPTFAMIGEGGEPEAVVPMSKMPEVSMAVQRALQGRKRRPHMGMAHNPRSMTTESYEYAPS